MFCKRCNVQMKKVMRFEKGKAYSLHKCPKCYYESKPTPLFFDERNISAKYNNEREKKKKCIVRT